MESYRVYVGCYVKRFYTKFLKENIFYITGYKKENGICYFEYFDGIDSWWSDIEDSVIITNESPIISDPRIANVRSSGYKGYNPYTKKP